MAHQENIFTKTSAFTKASIAILLLLAATGATFTVLGMMGKVQLSETAEMISALSILFAFPGAPLLWVFEQIIEAVISLD